MTTALEITWTTIADFWVDGVPRHQPRPRARAIPRKGQKPIAQVYEPKKPHPEKEKDWARLHAWKQLVSSFGLPVCPATPLRGAVRVDITFYEPRPKYMMTSKYPDHAFPKITKPDRDNLDKPVLDAMTKAGWWGDDCQVAAGYLATNFQEKFGKPGARIVVSVPMDDQQGLFV